MQFRHTGTGTHVRHPATNENLPFEKGQVVDADPRLALVLKDLPDFEDASAKDEKKVASRGGKP